MKILAAAILLLAGCASTPRSPDWQGSAYSALDSFTLTYLKGDTRTANADFARARSDIGSTGRADLLARAELVRCAVRVASLEFDDCVSYQPFAADAGDAERSYAAYLTARWQDIDGALLPAQHRPIAGASAAAISTIDDPLARLIAAGVLLQSTRLTPADMVSATETASEQGWRRPLLAWLGVQVRRAQDAGDTEAVARLQRRIRLVTTSQ